MLLDLKELQEEVIQNKINHGFNTTDVNEEFCYAFGELGEAHTAYIKKQDDVGEELADAFIYILGISEILGYDLGYEVKRKIDINKKRVYKPNKKGILVKTDELD